MRRASPVCRYCGRELVLCLNAEFGYLVECPACRPAADWDEQAHDDQAALEASGAYEDES